MEKHLASLGGTGPSPTALVEQAGSEGGDGGGVDLRSYERLDLPFTDSL